MLINWMRLCIHTATLQHTATYCNTLQHTATHWMRLCIHTYINIYLYIYTYIHVYTYIDIYVFTHMYIHTCTNTNFFLHICIYVHIHTLTHTHNMYAYIHRRMATCLQFQTTLSTCRVLFRRLRASASGVLQYVAVCCSVLQCVAV